MIARDSNSPRSPSSKQARESRQSTSTDCRDSYNLIANPSLIGSERRDPIRNNFSDQSGAVVLIGIDDSGMAVPFKFYSFIHPAASS